MAFYELAIRYLMRKKSKTVLLFLVLVFIGSMLLNISMILRATEKSEALIQEKTKAKIIIEVTNEKDKISADEIRQVSLLEGVAFINRQSNNFAFPVSSTPVTNSDSKEEENLKITIFSYDDLENDSAFFEQRYRLIEGSYINKHTKNGIVINSLLAELNGLRVGDTMELETEDGISVSAKIIGLFISGSERKQEDTTFSVNRIENHIFVDNTTYSKMFENNGYVRISVYAKKPEELDDLETKLRSIFSDKVDMTTSDTLFQQTKAPLEQIIRVANLMLILTFVTGTIVVTILLCMWMRTRKKEAAIYISIGKSKISILLQVLLEAFGVFVISVAGACGIGTIMAKFLKGALVNTQTTDMIMDVSLKLSDISLLLGIGSNIVLIAVIVSIVPILKANPRETLSRMEG
ncbi:ABC transporter permease [Aminipila sp.]|uniref:ABC transporter permease n=1 Tax=Aminipila sp. TaxID=2060095 RepID=UPI00289C4D90|nr:ABC transporter permease [Aminipila sp.]